jgi:uncharacterized membrane protein YesL
MTKQKNKTDRQNSIRENENKSVKKADNAQIVHTEDEDKTVDRENSGMRDAVDINNVDIYDDEAKHIEKRDKLQKEYDKQRDLENAAEKARTPKLKRGLDAFGNMFALNICFVVGCIPIFTIGASLTALYAMCIRIQEDEEETIVHGFIHEFKRSFKQGTQAFFLILVALGVMYAEFLLVKTVSGGLSTFYTGILILEVILFALTVPFLFPLIARYDNKLTINIRNSITLALTYKWSWVKVMVAWFAPIAFCILYPEVFLAVWYLWLLLLFGAIAYGTSATMRKIFRQNEQKLEDTAKAAEEATKKALEEATEETENSEDEQAVQKNSDVQKAQKRAGMQVTQKNTDKKTVSKSADKQTVQRSVDKQETQKSASKQTAQRSAGKQTAHNSSGKQSWQKNVGKASKQAQQKNAEKASKQEQRKYADKLSKQAQQKNTYKANKQPQRQRSGR